jgi:hypothetical protein
MAEERSCNNCGIDLICQECNEGNSKWQPISKSKVQHTKEEWASIIDDLDWNPDVMVELEQKGYIHKSAVEEAEEMYDNMIKNYLTTCGYFKIAVDYINMLKSEIARLRK